MKRILLASLALIVAASAFAQKAQKETIEGNGKSVTREVTVSSFDALQASGIYELRLSQGEKESVKIEADENLQQYFTVRNEGSKLMIDMDKLHNKNLRKTNKMKVYVTFKNLKQLELNTVGNVSSDEPLSFGDLELDTKNVGNVDLRLTAQKLDLENHGVGNVKLSGKASDAVVKHSGVGALQASDFVVQTMNIENTGVGGAEVNAEKSLKVKDSFLGKVKNKGNASMRKMNKVKV